MNQNPEPTPDAKITLSDVCQMLRAEVLCGQDKLDQEIKSACGCDLMSDVLAFTQPGSILLTGLTNQQVIRTAEMLDLKAVVFVRDKRPEDETLKLAETSGVPILLSPYPLYESCGRLYSKGLLGCDSAGKKSKKKGRSKDLEEPTTMPCGALWWGD